MKKLLAIVLSLTLALSLLTACGANGKVLTPSDVGAKAAKELTINLTEEEMQKSIEDYVVVLNGALAENDCKAKLTQKDNDNVAIVIMQGKDGQLAQELMLFKNIKEAFAYLLYTGQVDEQGKVLAEPVVSDGKEQPQDAASADTDTAPSGTESTAPTSNLPTSDATT